jgi:hypothetical protein
MVLAEASIVEKANKCFDFTFTTFFIHFIVTCSVYKFPNTLNWWISHAALVTITVLAAEYFCLKLETQEIKLSFTHILEKGKETVKEAAQIIKGDTKSHKNPERKNSKEMKKIKRKDKTEDV